MADNELDPLVARILLAGDDEFLSSLKRVGEQASENFSKLANAAEHGASSASVLTGALGLIEAAIAGASAATIAFVEQQTALSQKTILLADAFGTTAGQLQGLEAVFASSGVKVEEFERFANRLTITIAREWPAIAESIKTYANENDAATLRVSEAILNVREAQNKLGDNSAERASQISKDNNALEASYIKLQFAAQHAASEQVSAAQSVRGAELSSLAATQHLAALEGRPPSSAEKQNLAIAQAQQAVDQARHAEADARIAQQEKAANAALKVAQQQQEYADLARKASKDARDDAEQRQKDENAVKAAVIARGETEQKYAKLQLTNISSIRDALDGIVKGNKSVAGSVDFTQVSVQNLTKAFIAQAAEGQKAGEPPTGYKAMVSISETLSKATNDQISQSQRLAIVNHLAATGMQALGGVGAELLNVLEHDTEELKKFSAQADAINTKEAEATITAFRGALAGLNFQISLLSQRFAIAISPAFTAFMRSIQQSIESNTGVLSIFVDGIKAIGTALGYVGDKISEFVNWTAKMFNTQPAAIWKGIIVAIGVAIALAASALLAWPIILTTIVTVVGYIADNWTKIKENAAAAWQSVKDSALISFLSRVLEIAKSIWGYFAKIFTQPKTLPNNPDSKNSSNNTANASEGGDVQGNAEGGMIRGPGTGTSDSILSRLSNGEFVVKAAAVQAYGAGLFHALNNMQLPGFAQGGLVASPVRAGGGSIAPATSTLNLSIDGRSFNGLRGPKSTIDDLSSFAISRQASAAGSNPSWMK